MAMHTAVVRLHQPRPAIQHKKRRAKARLFSPGPNPRAITDDGSQPIPAPLF